MSPVQTVKLTLTWLNYADAACTFFTQQLGPFNSTTVVFFCYDLLGCWPSLIRMLKSLDKMSHFWKQKRILHESLIYHLHVWLVVCPHACYIDKRPWWGVISLTNALLKFLQVVYFQRMFSCLWYIHWLISRKIYS